MFNTVHLPVINEGYALGTIYYLNPISVAAEEERSGHVIYSRRQLGEILYPKLKKVLERRIRK